PGAGRGRGRADPGAAVGRDRRADAERHAAGAASRRARHGPRVPRRHARCDHRLPRQGLVVSRALRVVGLGGTVRPGSSSEQALRIAVAHAEALGATTRVFAGAELAQLPMYAPESADRCPVARELVEELRRADGVIVASPGYHGSI